MLTPKSFQTKKVKQLLDLLGLAAEHYQVAEPEDLSKVRAADGALILVAPTGVGKTFICTKAIDQFSAARKIVWFWFSPWKHLAQQTESVLRTESKLSVLDLASHRNPTALTGNAVFSLTWSSIAARDDVSRRLNENDDALRSVKSFIDGLRVRGYQVGVVIDEAHHGIKEGTEASEALRSRLRPDYCLFTTATPDEEALARAQAFLGYERIQSVGVSRAQGVASGLIKPSVAVVHFKAGDEHAGFLDGVVDIAGLAVAQAVEQHLAVKAALAAESINVTPLLLVQIDSAEQGIAWARERLVRAGISATAIRAHTADEPDLELQNIANNPAVEALIFKMAVATGFDAPRAFTLVSLRSSESSQFGLQVVGRILRVPRVMQRRAQLRAANGIAPSLLDKGYIFLADSSRQEGLVAAAKVINDVKDEVSQYAPATFYAGGSTLPTGLGDSEPQVPYTIVRPNVPEALWTQTRVFGLEDIDDLELQVAEGLALDEAALSSAMRTTATVQARTSSLFDTQVGDSSRHEAVIDWARQVSRGNQALASMPQLDQSALFPALIKRMRAQVDHADTEQLLHACFLLAAARPSPLAAALRKLRTVTKDLALAAPFPRVLTAQKPLRPSELNIFGVVPPDDAFDSGDELDFVEEKLADAADYVSWWMRNEDSKPYSCALVLPEGGRYFPDFVISVLGRPTPEGILLLEVKGAGEMEKDSTKEKWAAVHAKYGRPLMVTLHAGRWFVVERDAKECLIRGERFTWGKAKEFGLPARLPEPTTASEDDGQNSLIHLKPKNDN